MMQTYRLWFSVLFFSHTHVYTWRRVLTPCYPTRVGCFHRRLQKPVCLSILSMHPLEPYVLMCGVMRRYDRVSRFRQMDVSKGDEKPMACTVIMGNGVNQSMTAVHHRASKRKRSSSLPSLHAQTGHHDSMQVQVPMGFVLSQSRRGGVCHSSCIWRNDLCTQALHLLYLLYARAHTHPWYQIGGLARSQNVGLCIKSMVA